MKTEDPDYAKRLVSLESIWWKRLLDVQKPYRGHLRRLNLGFVLEVGCGPGRNLKNLGRHCSIGVDHNAQSVAVARARGLNAFTVEQFYSSRYARPHQFDALLLSHVIEHMPKSSAVSLLAEYSPFVRPGGKVVVITPQEYGFRSDPTHVHFVDFEEGAAIVRDARFEILKQYSFPFPRVLGRLFKYNEFVTIGGKAG